MGSSGKKPTVLIGVTIDGSIVFHQKLAYSLKAQGCSIHLVSTGGPNLDTLKRDFRTHELAMKRNPSPLKDLKSLLSWIKLIHEIKPDLVLIGTPKASLLGLVSARLLRIPKRIYFLHGLRLETVPGIQGAVLYGLEKLSLSSATEVIAVSPSLRTSVIKRKLSSSEKVTVLGSGSSQGIDTAKYKPLHPSQSKKAHRRSLNLKPEIPVIGFVGRITKEKGIAELGKALKSIKEAGVPVQLLILGEAEGREGEKFVDDLRKNGIHIVAPGFVHDPAPYFQAMDIFCLPTYREGFGNVILEAQASEVPVVSTQVTGVVDVVEEGKTGLLVPPKNSEALTKAILKILSSQNLASTLAINGRRFVQEEFDQNEVVSTQTKHILNMLRS